jgi:uncharacterized protein YkwD
MKSIEKSSFSRSACGLLRVVVLSLVIGVASVDVAAARETYLAYATRLLATPPEGAVLREDLEAAILRATNAYRASKKLPALKPLGEPLRSAARAQAVDLLVQGGMGHVSSTGHGFAARMRAIYQGEMILAPMAENAARMRNRKLPDVEKAAALVAQWIKSPGHRKNLTDRTYVSIAIGVVTSGDDIYAVQIFSGPQVKTNMKMRP